MNRNHFILIILFLIFPVRIFATPQGLDRLNYKGERLLILSDPPLEHLYLYDTVRPKFFGERQACQHTGCARGYQAEWTIEDNMLYLNGIYSCCYHEDSIKADLKEVFGDRFKDGRVLADWVTGKLYISKGKLIYSVHYRELNIYEKELEFTVLNGMVSEVKELDNSKTRKSKFANEDLQLRNHILDHIDYSNIPDPQVKKTVHVKIVNVTDQGKIDSVRVVNGADKIRNQEAIRIVKSIPEWDVLYHHGKKLAPNWTIGVRFGIEVNTKMESIH